WKDLVSEFKSVRKASIALFESLDEEQLASIGNANNNESNVIGIGFVTSGHVLHHCKIIRERYLFKN
ncbi:MAG: DinB family protein, partial [Flavitalea sp.]